MVFLACFRVFREVEIQSLFLTFPPEGSVCAFAGAFHSYCTILIYKYELQSYQLLFPKSRMDSSLSQEEVGASTSRPFYV